MNAEPRCELCGSADLRTLYEVDGYPVARCRVCGLVFVSRQPSESELTELYGQAYYEDGDTAGYDGYGAAETRKRAHDRSLLAMMERKVPPGELLEIGCAYGYFLDEARRRGWRVRGVEPSAHAAEQARTRFGLEVEARALTDRPDGVPAMDAVVMWDVIEHLPNPRQTLERIGGWLRPGGLIALSTGDVGSLSARLHGVHWSLMTPPWHLFYFSRSTMRRLLVESGFEDVSIGGDGSVAIDPASSNPRIRGVADQVLRSSPVTRVARRLGAGSIMYAFARKPVR